MVTHHSLRAPIVKKEKKKNQHFFRGYSLSREGNIEIGSTYPSIFSYKHISYYYICPNDDPEVWLISQFLRGGGGR